MKHVIERIRNRIALAWLRHPVIDGLLSGVAFVVVSLLLINFVLPAWAVTFQVGDLFVVKLDDWAPWIGISVTVLIWAEARRARERAAEAARVATIVSTKMEAVAVQLDGLMAARDEAKKKEGAEEQKLVGEDTAATLAKGQAQGRASAREASAPSPVPMTGGGERPIIQTGQHPVVQTGAQPVPVTDQKATEIALRAAVALESAAKTAEETAAVAAAEKKSPS